ncbi:ABC transporter substrate-binding protein [Pseudomonas gingeri]|uniref:ABC transporter substrate-binding protein n=1 Tax=Pseudomonas gingeri TaxID=117681 RepID=UPI0015A35020|nr:ABC transporter substrate-binding protein [Pseudomonas gingeri]NVZ99563.1 amino acid ABC transporter substrate-binding protein [Pseudomonas gingeri]NWA15415.1 amino acid ABC transporter substrate-binding protein [Pseudomonas gingeri]NWA56642.1 amino acid ABC transporter substrate-binding protein [Pseudomonas gingeri]NWA95136.1 amino acid ABC transporter substrate-binding protein [Pseudomonas gingeri]NWB05218.1 amino acid ABC transporter substrate-binding protein [Pseudomonas gingeri]
MNKSGIQRFTGLWAGLMLSLLAAAPAFALDTVEPGSLTIAFSGDMPGTGYQDSKMVGYDGEILQQISGKLGLKVKPALMEWSGTIASVQARRVDVMAGTMGWTEQRSKIMALSDPIHYFKNGITQTDKTDWKTLKDLQGKKVGTITGFSFIPEMRKIPGLQVTLYDTSDAAVRDLLAGRIDAVIGDPPVMQYAISRNAQWHLHFNAFTDNDPDFPLLTGLGQVVFGFNKDNPQLLAAVNEQIQVLWKTCEMRKIGARYGLTQDVWFMPQGKDLRLSVDRPADWKLPGCQ